MTTPTLLERLNEVAALLEMATPGDLKAYDANDGDGWPPRPLWSFSNEAYDAESDGIALQGSIHFGVMEDAQAIAAAINLLRDHGPALAAAVAERDELVDQLRDEISANLAFREAGGAMPDEDMPTFCARLIAERDELRALAAKAIRQIEADQRNGLVPTIYARPYAELKRAVVPVDGEG